MPDAIFAVPRLAQVYDPLDPDRGDLDVYAALAAEFGARSVLDVGCGTGAFACLLAGRGLAVTGVDPADAALEVARAKPGVSFCTVFAFGADGAVLTSESTLRFRDRADVERSLSEAGYRLDEVRDAPDRPGMEFVFIASRWGA